MSPAALIVIGGGEHARVLIEAARSSPGAWDVIGFVDPEPCEETQHRLALPRLGDDGEGLERIASGARFALGVGCVGVGPARRRIVERYDAAGACWATVVHATAWVSPTARLADGVLVSAGARINSGAAIGRHAVINTGAVVEHDVTVGDFGQVGPAAAVGGGTRLGEGCYVGLGARVRDHVEVGAEAMVAMGAVVVSSVAAGVVVAGVPASPLGGRARS